MEHDADEQRDDRGLRQEDEEVFAVLERDDRVAPPQGLILAEKIGAKLAWVTAGAQFGGLALAALWGQHRHRGRPAHG